MQKRLKPTTLDWDKVYVNCQTNKVLIFHDKEKTNLHKIITTEQFEKLLKRVPSINYLITLFI